MSSKLIARAAAAAAVAVLATSAGLARPAQAQPPQDTPECQVNVKTLTVSPSSFVGGFGAQVTASFTFDRPTPTFCKLITGSSDLSVARGPSPIYIGSGRTSGSFSVTHQVVSTARSIAINVSPDGLDKAASFQVKPSPCAGREQAYETTALNFLQAHQAQQVFEDDVKISNWWGSYTAHVTAKVTNPNSVDLKPVFGTDGCFDHGTVAYRFDVNVNWKDRSGSYSRSGTARISGDFSVVTYNGSKYLVFTNLKLASLNLNDVPGEIDDWLKGKLGGSLSGQTVYIPV
jgi:hypothetical protein